MVELQHGQHIHIVGIGGAGMSAIARILLGQGYSVSGSDRNANASTAGLAQAGATIYAGHAADNIRGADLLIATSAVPDDHIELAAAQQAKIPVYRRSDIISALMPGKHVIAVAGTHGKTTTTAMIVHILQQAGHDPSYIVGGTMQNNGTNAGVGAGDAFVIEADEYGHMFLGLKPHTAIITNIEWDHPDYFTTPEMLATAFADFVARLPDDGLLVGFADDSRVRDLLAARASLHRPTASYAQSDPSAQWRGANLRYEHGLLTFDVVHTDQMQAALTLQIPGQHNAMNALAAIAATTAQGVTVQQAADALATFTGTGRRFELRADFNGIAIVDDYAHHPTAIKATIEAARQRYPERDLWAIWQPHTYSRTLQLWHDFLGAFAAAQHVLITDVYAAREQAPPDFDIQRLVAAMQHPQVQHTPTHEQAVALLLRQVQAPAVVLIMSAGDAPQIGQQLQRRLIDYSKGTTHD